MARDAFNPSEPRDPKGEWTSGGGSAATAKAGEAPAVSGYKPGLKASKWQAENLRKQQWIKTAPTTVEGLYRDAEANQKQLADLCTQITNALGGGVVFKNPGVKGRPSLEAKLGLKKPQQVTDVVRCGFDTPDPSQGSEIVRRLAEHFEVADEGWTRTPDGYFDRKTIVRFKDGSMGEVQMWPPGMLDAKEKGGGHEAYKEMMKLPAGDLRRIPFQHKQMALYGGVMAKLSPSWAAQFD